MIRSIITFSVNNKLIITLFVLILLIWGGYSISKIPIGAVPDITTNQVQIITTSRSLATEEVEKFITYPVELEMANLPGVTDIRSISKFGLSVVTVVFEDNMGTYLPRQLIAEKLKSAEEMIPASFGSPFMGPISTGLGEIYQYTLDTKPGYEDKYSAMDLRTIQDWIVKRNLSGIPGVVEVNTWGGYLKQYEVALNPHRLFTMNVSVAEVLKALKENNSITGGGYIEKNSETYFIRGDGQIASLEDIENIVVKNRNGIPILINDLAKVQFGYANRFGAITANGEGEKVMGQIMMLKDANSSQVIERVKERVKDIEDILPEGIYINPFLERTELIEKTTGTVKENLILGALIVIFVLVLLLGNLRSGLIVASVIPISLLFGISMMNLFGISVNLMSLGAIDFGIIIDGAVIIVEFILFKFTQISKSGVAVDNQIHRNKIAIDSATQVMEPAIFGQIIILVVFIPILALTGIEGKMFRPMALSFSFTLIGAMILSLTYIPMMTSVFFNGVDNKNNVFRKISNRIMSTIYRLYRPVLLKALKAPKLVLSLSGVALISSVIIFSRLGGEFVPTLDEGDYVVQPILKTGTSLSKTIEILTDLESILKRDFPDEVKQVVSRIGAAEVPTDPMSMEETDLIIKLFPKEEWVKAKTKEELAAKMINSMSVIPGVEFEFTQPIEMRFNELITGVRSDVALKLFGNNLDSLAFYANSIKTLIENVEGAADIIVEKTENLPQITVSYNRARLAQLGLNISIINQTIQMAFGGAITGSVYEGERRFNLVARMEEPFRSSMSDMEMLFIDLPNGEKIPLKEVATVTLGNGPAKISRDNTRRRIVIGINIRNKDVETVVENIQAILNHNLELPEGYHLTYGGQFQNLREAKKRLQVAVPASLLLIFTMLYFAFKSVRQALLVYSAIPLAAIGGVLALWSRGIPFSISAGVGFIALFGIAVLNGIVLIEFFNTLKKEGVDNLWERIIQGTRQRLRPVLLTASAAALGFLPMAISTSAGAEVQRPLATVVIGGLFTATLLTLVVLPILYYKYGEPGQHKQTISSKLKLKSLLLIGILFFLVPLSGKSQDILSREQAIEYAVKNNPKIQATRQDIDRNEALKKASVDLGLTTLYHSFDENNLTVNDIPLNVYGINQSIPFPTILSRKKSRADSYLRISEKTYEVELVKIKRDVSILYNELLYLDEKLRLIENLDSLYQIMEGGVEKRYKVGDSDKLELLNIKAYRVNIQQIRGDLVSQKSFHLEELKRLTGNTSPIDIVSTSYKKISPVSDLSPDINKGLERQSAVLSAIEESVSLEKSKWLPDINLQYFVGRNVAENVGGFNGYQIGLSFPLFLNAYKGNYQAKVIEYSIQENLMNNYRNTLNTKQNQLKIQMLNVHEKLNYFEGEGLTMAAEIQELATVQYNSGETDFSTFSKSMENVYNLRTKYLDILNSYNRLALELKYLIIE